MPNEIPVRPELTWPHSPKEHRPKPSAPMEAGPRDPGPRQAATGHEHTRPPPPTIVRPVSNATSILRLLSRSGTPATLTQISRDLGINVSTCFNILRTLVWEEFVEFEPATKCYSLGFGMVPLVQGILAGDAASPAVKERLHQLANSYRLTITVWRPTGDRLVLIAVVDNHADLRIQMRLGQKLPLLSGASGRIMAGRMDVDKEEIKRRFAKLKWARPISFDRYWRDAQLAVERGWAMDDGVRLAGMTTVSVPVLNHQGGIARTLTAAMFRGQHDERGQHRIAAELLKISQQMSVSL